MKDTIVILTGGGPAPGINTVIGSISKTFISKGYRVLGMHGGYSGLFKTDPDLLEFDFALADSIFNKGGSYIRMSRYKPTKEDFEKRFNMNFFKENNIKLMVTIGGDDTASTANRVAEHLEKQKFSIKNIHVPKTIDNDLPLPHNTPTFGYHSAKAEGTRIAATVYEDAKTSGNWFLVAAMGRSAGHLAFGIGASCHYPMIVIPEMFDCCDITVDKIVKLVISSIVKRKILGINYGGVVISEGVFHSLSDEEIKNCGISFSYDAHGHPELGKVSKSQVFNEILEKELKNLELKVATRPVEIGYEVRCQIPVAYDLMYCTQLGLGVWDLFSKDESKCMVFVDRVDGAVYPLHLSDIQDPLSGKISPRLVDIRSEKIQSYIKGMMHYITEDDYQAAKSFIPDPQEYDFFKILKWTRI